MTVSMSVGTRLDELIAVQEQRFLDRQPALPGPAGAGRRVAGRRGHLELADLPAPGRLDQPRPRLPGLGRRRQRVRRPARRLRRHGRRPRPPGGGGRGQRPGRQGHPLRPADRRGHRGRRGAGQALRPAAVALRQLRHRGDHGRRPPDAGHHRALADRQGRGLLPRPPRLGAGVGVPAAGGARPGPRPGQRGRLQRHPGRDRRADLDRALQRPRGDRAGLRRARRPRSPACCSSR